MLNNIRNIYRETRNEIITPTGLTECFWTTKGVRQGCPLSPCLFCIFINDIEERWERLNIGGSEMGLRKIFCLKFADDIGVIAKTIDGLQDMIKELETYITRNRLEINTQKSQIIVFRSGGQLGKQESWTYLGQKLMVVNQYKCLGYMFSPKNSPVDQVQLWASKGQSVLNTVGV
uniref:Reverse transcriptase domain-containing protein n=1 Tax=Strigamia maritima TaxID=126957 RepID=T1IW68_STRMM